MYSRARESEAMGHRHPSRWSIGEVEGLAKGLKGIGPVCHVSEEAIHDNQKDGALDEMLGMRSVSDWPVALRIAMKSQRESGNIGVVRQGSPERPERQPRHRGRYRGGHQTKLSPTRCRRQTPTAVHCYLCITSGTLPMCTWKSQKTLRFMT